MKRVAFLIFVLSAGLIPLSLSAEEAKKPGTKDGTLAASASKTAPSGLVWYSYPEALKKSKKENKHVMVHFTAVWCGWCKKMEKETYTDTSIIRTLGKDFVLTKVWGDTDSLLDIDGYQISERQLGQTQFGVRSFPTLAFVSPTGEKLGTLAGYRQAPELLRVLEFIRDRKYDTTRNDTLPVSPADYKKNAQAAEETMAKCKSLIESSDLTTLMKLAKQNMDVASQNCLSLMELATSGWNAENEKFSEKLETSGLGLFYNAQHDCILSLMQSIRSKGGESSTGFSDLLHYYGAFEQTFKYAMTPNGTLQTYKQSLADLRAQTTQASAKLDVLLK